MRASKLVTMFVQSCTVDSPVSLNGVVAYGYQSEKNERARFVVPQGRARRGNRREALERRIFSAARATRVSPDERELRRHVRPLCRRQRRARRARQGYVRRCSSPERAPPPHLARAARERRARVDKMSLDRPASPLTSRRSPTPPLSPQARPPPSRPPPRRSRFPVPAAPRTSPSASTAPP